MSFLSSALSAIEGGNNQSLASEAVSLIENHPGGLSGLVQQFHDNGMGQVVTSWVSSNANQPITAEQLQQVLGPNAIQEIAGKLGMNPDQVASGLSLLLPQVIDHLTPGGQLPQGGLLEEGLSLLKGRLQG